MRASFLRNLGYFWVGRFGGALPYFLPARRWRSLLFLARGPARPRGLAGRSPRSLRLVALLHLDDPRQLVRRRRHGGQPLLPEPAAAGVPVPGAARARARRWSRPALAGARSCSWRRCWLAPLRHSLAPRRPRACARAFRALPAELTMLNDLSVFTEPWRKKRPYGFTGDASTPRRCRRVLPLLSGRRHLRAARSGASRRLLAARRRRGGGGGARLRHRSRRAHRRAGPRRPARRPGERAPRVPHEPRRAWGPARSASSRSPCGRGVRYYDTYLYVLRFESRRGAPLPDGRAVGAFVDLRLVLGRTPRRVGEGAGGALDRPRRRLGPRAARRGTRRRPSGVGRTLLERRATYHAMAGSLAFDRGPRCSRPTTWPACARLFGRTAGRLPEARAGRERVHAGSSTRRRLSIRRARRPSCGCSGVDRGLLLLNACVLVRALWLGYGELRRRDASGSAPAGRARGCWPGRRARLPASGRRPRSSTSASSRRGSWPSAAAASCSRPCCWASPSTRSPRTWRWRCHSLPRRSWSATRGVAPPCARSGASRAARGGRGGRARLRFRLAGHGRAQLPGRRAQDLLRPLSVRPRRRASTRRASG